MELCECCEAKRMAEKRAIMEQRATARLQADTTVRTEVDMVGYDAMRMNRHAYLVALSTSRALTRLDDPREVGRAKSLYNRIVWAIEKEIQKKADAEFREILKSDARMNAYYECFTE